MIPHARSIRFRLTLISLVIVTVTLVLVSAILLRLRRQELLADFDESLENHALVILDSIDFPDQMTRPSDESRLVPYRFPGYYIQVRREDGTVVERSANLEERALPLPDSSRLSGEPPLLMHTFRLDVDANDQPDSLRVLTVLAQDSEHSSIFLQIGRSLASVEDTYSELRRLLIILVPIAIALSGAASYLFANHALSPLRQIVEDTRQLSAENLHERLPIPTNDDEMAELARTMNDMLERVDNAFLAQERFISNASHELRTPISVIMGATSVLRQQSRSIEEYDEFVSGIEDEVRGLANMINSLLVLSRAGAGLPPDANANVSMNDVVIDAVSRCQSQAVQREVRLTPHLALPMEGEAEPQVHGDAQLLTTMVINLLRNAIRFSPVEETVEVRVSMDPGHVRVSVRDRGPGIPNEHIERVFDRFYNVPIAGQGYQGVGLGLAIVKGVAEVHGGNVTLANHLDGGCEFVVTLPRIASPATH